MQVTRTTFSGILFDILDPESDDFRITDIAHHLSMESRFGGSTIFFYSVAQHSVYLSHIVPDDFKLAALLHDGTEAYLRDIPRPIKVILPEYVAIEQLLGARLALAFNLPVNVFEAPQITAYDEMMMCIEAASLLANPEPIFAKYGRPDRHIRSIDPNFGGWDPDYAEQRFLDRFNELVGREVKDETAGKSEGFSVVVKGK